MATRQSTESTRSAPEHQQYQAAARPKPSEEMRVLEGDLFDKRLRAIRTRLWNIAGIVACVIAAEGEEGTTDAGNALQLVRRELQAIADNELYSDELLAADAAQEVRS